MADKSSRGLPTNMGSSTFNLAPSETPKPRKLFNPAEEDSPPPPAPVKPASKGGRPKGITKVKKTFYLATDLSDIEQIQINLARHAGILAKDESAVVDLALEVLAVITANAEYTALIHSIYKKRKE